PADGGRKDQEIAEMPTGRPLHLLADDDVEADEGDGGAQPLQGWHALVTGDRGQQRDDDGRGAEDQRPVADAGALDAAEEEERVEAVADDTEEHQPRPIARDQPRRRRRAVLSP